MAVGSREVGTKGGGSEGGGSGYMQGIAAIGGTLNQTHSNVLNTIDYFNKNSQARSAAEKKFAQEATLRGMGQNDRSQNLSALGYLSGERERMQGNANRKGRTFRQALSESIGG